MEPSVTKPGKLKLPGGKYDVYTFRRYDDKNPISTQPNDYSPNVYTKIGDNGISIKMT